jgi:hypothetical protein
MQYDRLISPETFTGEMEYLKLDVFIKFEAVKRFQNRRDVRQFWRSGESKSCSSENELKKIKLRGCKNKRE